MYKIMCLMENTPRITLTQMSKNLGVPISTLWDNMKKIDDKFIFVGKFKPKKTNKFYRRKK